jgi:hypothetical protein
MALKRFSATSVAEVAVALTIIAICFVVATQVFVQTNRSTIQFKEVKEQTEAQSLLLDALIHDTLPTLSEWRGELSSFEQLNSRKDSVNCAQINLISSQKTIWQQVFFHEAN